MKPTTIVYGNADAPLMQKAIAALSEILLDYTGKYPSCVSYAEHTDYSQSRCIYIGTKQNNPYIAQHTQSSLSSAESYSIVIQNDTVIIEGFDDAGVLYGCLDFYNQYIIRFEFAHAKGWESANYYWRNIFEAPLPDYACSAAPSVRHRGIWTWGHVIYNFRSFIDHMLKLKLNTLIIWNDFVPVNAKEMIEYAHHCGIKVIWGFSWGWDTGCSSLSLTKLKEQSRSIFAKFREEYSALDIDGIYFQSITEMEDAYLEGVLVAEAVTDFVNCTAKPFFDWKPDLELQFGLHATSVSSHLDFIQKVDPRIRIVWEDCGAFPFSYFPHDVENFAETKKFTADIAALRGADDKFGIVAKGMTKLDWQTFEHQDGSAFLGVSSKAWRKESVARKNRDWRYFQAYWLVHGRKALEMFQTLADSKNGDLYITALVEDGMLEENIMFPVALYAEMLWNCHADISELIRSVALRDDTVFA